MYTMGATCHRNKNAHEQSRCWPGLGRYVCVGLGRSHLVSYRPLPWSAGGRRWGGPGCKLCGTVIAPCMRKDLVQGAAFSSPRRGARFIGRVRPGNQCREEWAFLSATGTFDCMFCTLLVFLPPRPSGRMRGFFCDLT